MKWLVSQAKNGEKTLLVNDFLIYSKYEPKKDANKWINKEVEVGKKSYLLIGLGLGYHLEALSQTVPKNSSIIVYYFENQEREIFEQYSGIAETKYANVSITNILEGYDIDNNTQILIPDVWIRAIGQSHALFPTLDVMKNLQRSYKKNADKMYKNFLLNSSLHDSFHYPTPKHDIACLVSAGPSLNETVQWLKKIQERVDIYVVGAALQVLEQHSIIPTGVVISDANDSMQRQLINSNYIGDLYYLSTANHTAILPHKGKRYMLLQEGYKYAEQFAGDNNAPLIETGGSVGITTFSLIELLGYKKIILFGQDLGFKDNSTHATLSTSSKKNLGTHSLRKIPANVGEAINTTPSLYAFWYWYNTKMKNTTLEVYNTAKDGAKIVNVPYIDEMQLLKVVTRG